MTFKKIDINSWNRKRHYHHFIGLADPYYDLTIPFDVTTVFNFSKTNRLSFFAKYLHDCMIAINSVPNFKYRILDDDVVEYDVVNASATFFREDTTFGFSYIKFDNSFSIFLENLNSEKQRVLSTNDLYSPVNAQDCVHCSALPWFNFLSHKEPVSGQLDSIPKLSFGQTYRQQDRLMMNVGISVNHALIDGYHIGQFCELFQHQLNLKL